MILDNIQFGEVTNIIYIIASRLDKDIGGQYQDIYHIIDDKFKRGLIGNFNKF